MITTKQGMLTHQQAGYLLMTYGGTVDCPMAAIPGRDFSAPPERCRYSWHSPDVSMEQLQEIHAWLKGEGL